MVEARALGNIAVKAKYQSKQRIIGINERRCSFARSGLEVRGYMICVYMSTYPIYC